MTTKTPRERRTLAGESIPFYAFAVHLVDGDLEAILLLSLLSHLADDAGWVRASAEEIEHLSALSRRKQERARRVLLSRALLEERLEGMPARLAFRALVCFDEKGKQDSTKREDKVSQSVEPCFDEKGNHAATKGENKSSLSVETVPHQGAELDLFAPPSSTCIRSNTEEQKTATKPAATKPPKRAPPLDLDPVEVARGALDSERPEGLALRWELASLALAWWATVWGKRTASVALTGPRRKAWTAAFAGERRRPSAFFAAIVGMTHDPWPERDAHNDWPLLLRHLEKWADLGVRAGFVAALRPSALSFRTKDVAGVVVPESYDWQAGDEYCRAKGERFDPRTSEWVRRDDSRWAVLGVVSPPPGGRR